MAFANAALGSVVLVTTCNENIAISMRATTYFLSQLSDEDCWNVFVDYAFRHRDPNADSTLREIGEKIVRKCRGLPLAAKVFGSLLYSVVDAEKWDEILQSKMWDLPADKSSMLPSLRISYQLLPLHLKPCFAYCSIFPKGYEIDKGNLIQLWMAEGLLQPSKTKTMQKVGEEYFHELLLRSLIQRSISNDSSFFMHDLLSNLAQYVGGEFFHMSEEGSAEEIPEKVRHLSFLQDKLDAPEKFEAFYDLSQLRTFLPFRLSDLKSQAGSLTDGIFNILLPRFIVMRVLSLSGYPITTLPTEIGNLKHLRYLNLSCTKIRQLPESAGHLYNLQTLLLSNCGHLTSLPKKMRNLIDLRHLDIIGTRLTEMPPHFGRLKLLQRLTAFVVSKDTGSRISELGPLLQLHGVFSIVNLQNVIDATDALEANLKGKKFIDELVFRWTAITHARSEAIVLDNLQPHENLKGLKIQNYGGMTFPGWLGNSSFSNMISVHLIGCINCSTLPPLGQLSSLKTLLIKNMKSLARVDHEFYGNGNSPFRSLEILTFEEMPIWEEWVPIDFEEFPSLKELHMRICPVLTGNLPQYLGSLNTLVISGCYNLSDSLPMVPMLGELELIDCDALVSLHEEMMQGNSRLRKLTISNCPLLQSFLAHSLSTTLNSLQIRQCIHLELPLLQYAQLTLLHLESSCDTLVSFPLSSFKSLRDLHIQDCPNLQSLWISTEIREELLHLENIKLKDCPNLVSFPDGGLPTPNLQSLCICNCENLSPQVKWGLHEMTSLESFRLEGPVIGLQSFPDEGLLPACLTSLRISGLVNLTYLNQTGFLHLDFLKLLEINACTRLQSLPARGLPISLSTLIIMDCPLLVPLCQRETGAYWNLISHIPYKVIDEEVI